MRTNAFIRTAVAVPLLLFSGCVVYRHVPQTTEYTPAQVRWSDSVSALREAEFAAILTASREQQRTSLTRRAALDSVARARAWDMARRGYFAHVNPEGIGPNTLLARIGYVLPAAYDHRPEGNNVESAAAGYRDARAAWRYLLGSPHHRRHVLGLNAQFATQTEFGIGYAWRPNSRYGHYWVVLIAEPAGPAEAAAP